MFPTIMPWSMTRTCSPALFHQGFLQRWQHPKLSSTWWRCGTYSTFDSRWWDLEGLRSTICNHIFSFLIWLRRLAIGSLQRWTMKTRMQSLSRFCNRRGSTISRSYVVLVLIHIDSLDAPSVDILSLTSPIQTRPKSSKHWASYKVEKRSGSCG